LTWLIFLEKEKEGIYWSLAFSQTRRRMPDIPSRML
jgi:hypothetical protein